MLTIDTTTTEPTTDQTPSESDAIAALIEDIAAHPETTTRDVVDDYRIVRTYNGTPNAGDHYSVNGKVTQWDAELLSMLACKRGAEMLVYPQIKINRTTGVPSPVYATAKIKAARDRIMDAMPHAGTRIRIERMSASVGNADGAVTYGALLVTVKPTGR